ncbi:MAG: sensor histidine kinase [Acidobacteriota bacterium]|nr:sensor histidine kinase [Acidobacteriota bacterium]
MTLASWTIVAVALGYLGLLFAVAWFGDRRAEQGRSLVANPWVYALSMAVYCTAWTFYGSVGRAATAGVGFLPIYLGPTLAAALSLVVLRKIVRISKVERITSIADFVASRYGKSRALGAVVTVIAVLGIGPYIALQLKAVATSYLLLVHGSEGAIDHGRTFAQTSLAAAVVLAVFAILFGTRHLDLTERHEGLVLAIAFESVVKLVAFLAVGLYVCYGLFDGFGDIFQQAAQRADLAALMTFQGSWGTWSWMVALAMTAILFLPRQFQVSVVENVDERHIPRAAWLFPLYLLAINLFVLPIAFAGRLRFGGTDVEPDTFVLSLPLAEGQGMLALLVFVGGLSAATGMVIVESVALSTMVSNDLVLPLVLRKALDRRDPNVGTLLLRVRRVAIVVILALGQLYLISASAEVSLVSVGLISFAAIAQLAPAILGGLYWRGGTRRGALAALVSGVLVWGYTLPLPTLASSGWISPAFVEQGPFGIGWLRPYALFGLGSLEPIPHAMFWSLLINTGCYLVVSSLGGQSPLEVGQARRFVDVFRRTPATAGMHPELPLWRADTPVATIRSLLERFLGVQRTERALDAYFESRGLDPETTVFADAELAAFAERLLAGTTGAASAHIALASVAQEQSLSVREVVHLLDETSRVIATSRQLEEKSQQLEAATAELRAANEQLRELDRVKDDFLATMAHELRTPLTSIRSFTEILYDHPNLDPAERRRFLDIVLKENERLTRLINQILDLAKIEAGEPAGARAPVDLNELVRDAVTAVTQLAEERGVAVETRLGTRAPHPWVDRDRLMQVLLNLLSNGLKFSRRRLVIEVSSAEGEIQVSVADDGPGIDPEERQSVFEKFRQVPGREGGRSHGTGLGLPICRGIVEGHGGRIWVESSRWGGARLIFTLLAEPPPQGELHAP